MPPLTLFKIYIEPQFLIIILYLMCFSLVYSVKSLWYTRRQLLAANKSGEEHQSRLIADLGHNYGNIAGIGLHDWNMANMNIENIRKSLNSIIEANDSKSHSTNVKLYQLKQQVLGAVQNAHEGRNVAEISQLILQAQVKNLCVDVRRPEYDPLNIRTIFMWLPNLVVAKNRILTYVGVNMPNIVYIESSVFFNCLMNIVTNALKHTDGNVYIESSYTSGRLNVRITDEGPGITKENQHRIFERNFRVSTKTSGLGIGLHSVRESLRWLGSECHIDSPYVSSPAKFGGKDVLNTYGSSFWFELRDENFTCVPAYKEKETAQEAGQLTEAGNKAATAKQVQVNLTTNHENKGSTDLVWNVKGFESTLGKEAKDAIKIFFAEENGIIDDLSLALEKNDFDTVLRRIHKLKTSCKILSAERLYMFCKLAEEQKGALDLNKFEAEFTLLCSRMKDFLGQKKLFTVLLVEDNQVQSRLVQSQLQRYFSRRSESFDYHIHFYLF